MRVAIGVLFPAIVMGCAITLITVAIFMTQKLFAGVVLASPPAGALIATARRRTTRRSQPGSRYPAPTAAPQPLPVSRCAASQMSLAFSPGRCAPALPPGRCLP